MLVPGIVADRAALHEDYFWGLGLVSYSKEDSTSRENDVLVCRFKLSHVG